MLSHEEESQVAMGCAGTVAQSSEARTLNGLEISNPIPCWDRHTVSFAREYKLGTWVHIACSRADGGFTHSAGRYICIYRGVHMQDKLDELNQSLVGVNPRKTLVVCNRISASNVSEQLKVGSEILFKVVTYSLPTSGS